MASRPRAFIDSNVLANWLLLSGAIQRLKPEEDKLKEIKEVAGRKWPSYILLKTLKELGKKNPFIFGTSFFAFAETTHVILQEYIVSRLHEKGIPFEFWRGLRSRERLTEKDERDLCEQQYKLLTTFFEYKNQILRWYDRSDAVSASVLITSFRVSTTDSFLVSQARKGKCDYFVTEDRRLRESLSKYGQIEAISAQVALDHLRTASQLAKMGLTSKSPADATLASIDINS